MINDSVLELSLEVFKNFDIFPMPPGAYQDTPERKARYQKIGLLIIMGYGTRTIAAAVGVSRNTVKKIRNHMAKHNNLGKSIKCECGKERGHQGWCNWRLQKSIARQQVVNRLIRNQIHTS
jgi:DNA-binding NarL/FixJ family response regulator